MSAAHLEALLGAAFARSDALFARLSPEDLGARPIGLRHPFLFYVGHLPAFAYNQVRGALGLAPLHERFDRLFARGIDPDSDEAARSSSIDAWPPLDEVIAYRDEARRAVRERLPELLAREDDPLCARGRLLHIVVEHEVMHHETLMYMLQEHVARRAPVRDVPSGPGRSAEPRRIPAGDVVMGVDLDDLDFAWDNEIGHLEVEVPAFVIDSLPVRNLDYRAFLDAHPGGAPAPRSWIVDHPAGPHVKTVLGPVPFELAAGWPVQVSGEEARAYAAWRGGRLPTEAEIRRAAFGDPEGRVRPYPWGDEPPSARHGNFDFARWTPLPVGSSPAGASAFGVEELVGNGWEWTRTPFAPLPGFVAWARTYPGYSADFFDGEHDVVFGASWATDKKLLRPSLRNWYRRDYPYVFSSFRVAFGDPPSSA